MSVEIQRHIAEILRRQRKAGTSASLRISINPSVLERLRSEDEQVLVSLEREFNTHLTFVADQGLHIEEFVVADSENNHKLYSNVDNASVI